MSSFGEYQFNPFLGGGRHIPASTKLISHPDLWGEDGVLNVMPQAFWESVTPDERSLFGYKHGVYAYPTTELIARLRAMIGGREARTIEIGAGNGGMAKALGIVATDSYQQATNADVRRYVQDLKGEPVRYGPHVAKMDYKEAIRRHKPEVVLGCWVTHRYNPLKPHLAGNQWGLDEHWILSRCAEYIFVGAKTLTHDIKPLFADLKAGKIRTHEIVSWETGPLIQSRAQGDGILVHIRRKSA